MNQFKVKSQELIGKIEELIKDGNAKKIIIKDEHGKTYIEIPVTIGVLGALCAPVLTAVGALAGMAANFTIEIIPKKADINAQKTENDTAEL